MTNEPITTIVGNLAADPELRFTPSGVAVANFRVGSTPSTFDRNRNEFVDGVTVWMDCTAWRGKAEAVAEVLKRGTRVVILGHLRQEEWEDRESGSRRTKIALNVVELGVVPFAPKAGEGQPRQQASRQAPDENPWSTAPAAAGASDEPPF